MSSPTEGPAVERRYPPPGPLAGIGVFLIRLYRRHRTRGTPLCVFVPSCTEYAILALRKYGAFRGAAKIAGRLLRCRPPNGGEDWP